MMRRLAALMLIVVACGIVSVPTAHADHDYGGYECMDHEYCGGGWGDGGDGGYSEGNQGYGGGGGRSGDMEQDGDNNCRNFCFYGVPMPGEQRQQSLFPPTPEGVRDFVLNTMKGGIELGRLFAEATITFVENLFIGLA